MLTNRKDMNKRKVFLPILIPGVTVFIANACIMVLELDAGRLIARDLGSSVYTWTSVIGIVLAGISIGNYFGGRIADRFPAAKTLAVLFGIISLGCVVIVVLNNLVGNWMWLWRLSWSMRVFSHTALMFLIPSTLLGMANPVVVKMALDRGLATGRTVGSIYAWGAAGSIAGTFLAGFYLLAALGTAAVVWVVGATVVIMGILYQPKFRVLYVWAVIFASLMIMGMASADWAGSVGSALALRKKPDPSILYEDESQYCYIAVKRISENPDRRIFMQDKLKHSDVIMGDINNLQYFHTIIFAGITHRLSQDREKLSVLNIGGGGYVFPQYVEKNWPGSRIDVAEIDPGVTEAAMAAFGLKRNTTINTITMDARNYVDELLEEEKQGKKIPRYDFIYEDAFSDYSVPYQLVTKEFHDKIFKILTDEGVYMINMIDTYDSGLFLGTLVNTLEKTFPYVYVMTNQLAHPAIRGIYVVVAAKYQFEPEAVFSGYNKDVKLWYFNESDINYLKEKSEGIILTDDYAPVENLLAPVVRQSAREFLAEKVLSRAEKLAGEGKFDESIENYEEAVELNPMMSIKAYNDIGFIQTQKGRLNEAVETFQKALEYDEQMGHKNEMAAIHFNIAVVLKRLGQDEEAREHFQKSADEFRELSAVKPHSVKLKNRLGDALASMGDFKGACQAFRQALALNPDMGNYYNLVKALELQGRYDEAIEVLSEGIEFMLHQGQNENAAKMQRYLKALEQKKSQQDIK